MNEKVTQLWRQVELQECDCGCNPDEFLRLKFAELIVRECIQVCNSRVGNSDYNTGRMHCASDLKEHFGVEE